MKKNNVNLDMVLIRNPMGPVPESHIGCRPAPWEVIGTPNTLKLWLGEDVPLDRSHKKKVHG